MQRILRAFCAFTLNRPRSGQSRHPDRLRLSADIGPTAAERSGLVSGTIKTQNPAFPQISPQIPL
jgi:hypothetical protein